MRKNLIALRVYQARGENMVKITIDYTKCAGAADKICVEI